MTDDWRFQYPSTTLKRTFKGDTEYAGKFRGEADKLLYQLKNNIKFQRLGQLKMTRFFTDGTVITAWSHFGQDRVEVDVTKAEKALEVSCVITLFDLPESIPPMTYPGEIHEGEVEGTDYIKTYYTVDVSKCPLCSDPDFTICTTDELAIWDDLTPTQKLEAYNKCKPFEYVDDTVDHKEGEDDNHCVYSDSECQAEIILFAEDGGGTYFLWKAYTEWAPTVQDGLGYVLLRGFIIEEAGAKDICTSPSTVIAVDCCEKYTAAYRTIHPELEDLDINYTSVVVPCGMTETLNTHNGCPPFTWSIIAGGGTLTPQEDGSSVVYQAPATNPNCINNPTIMVTDRCENTAQLKLAVNCLTANAGMAWKWEYLSTTSCIYWDTPPTLPVYQYDVAHSIIGCNGGLFEWVYTEDEVTGLVLDNNPPAIEGATFCGMGLYAGDEGECLNCFWGRYGGFSWQTTTASCDPLADVGYNGAYCDRRTDEQKEAGCCPVNPVTGEPW